MKLKALLILTFATFLLGLGLGYARQTRFHDSVRPHRVLRVLAPAGLLQPELLAEFERTQRIRVLVDSTPRFSQMESRLETSLDDYDLVLSWGSLLSQHLSRFRPVPDFSQLPVSPEVSRLPGHPAPGLAPAIFWGVQGVAINSKKLPHLGEPLSWSDLLRLPQLRARIGFPADPIEVIGLLQRRGRLSGDVFQALETPQGRTRLREFTDFVEFYSHWDAEPLLKGDWLAAQLSNGLAAQLSARNSEFQFLIPLEGADIWTLHVALVEGGQAEALAMLRYLFRADISKKLSLERGLATTHTDLEDDAHVPTMAKASFLRSIPVRRLRFFESAWVPRVQRLEKLVLDPDES